MRVVEREVFRDFNFLLFLLLHLVIYKGAAMSCCGTLVTYAKIV